MGYTTFMPEFTCSSLGWGFPREAVYMLSYFSFPKASLPFSMEDEFLKNTQSHRMVEKFPPLEIIYSPVLSKAS